ncbi:MAG: lipopolysaccharide heptosyltransferase I [Comamonadaceae bacterium]|nr:MAG: lipopolysaccharide heptosyltransferase I [Comamonadaceae bacterium]
MKILLVKLSSLGDVVHALPVLHDIHAALPGTRIDWVVEKSFAPLLAPLANTSHGLDRVIPCEIRRWRKSFWTAATRAEWRRFKAQLQLENYDAVIDLQGLAKSALVARLAQLTPGGKRFALANQTEGSGYEAPTRWVADVAIYIEPHIHAVQRSRELCAKALGYEMQGPPDFGLQAVVQAAEPAESSGLTHLAPGRPVVAFVHGTSRADKTWPLAQWVELGQKLNAAGFQVGLPHGSDAEQATSEAIAAALNAGDAAGHATGVHQASVWPRLSLDTLTPALAGCAGVIGVDSGPSHIAVALDLPHVQIYNFDTAWRTGPLAWPGEGRLVLQRSVFDQPTPGVDAVWRAWLACLAAAVQRSED